MTSSGSWSCSSLSVDIRAAEHNVDHPSQISTSDGEQGSGGGREGRLTLEIGWTPAEELGDTLLLQPGPSGME